MANLPLRPAQAGTDSDTTKKAGATDRQAVAREILAAQPDRQAMLDAAQASAARHSGGAAPEGAILVDPAPFRRMAEAIEAEARHRANAQVLADAVRSGAAAVPPGDQADPVTEPTPARKRYGTAPRYATQDEAWEKRLNLVQTLRGGFEALSGGPYAADLGWHDDKQSVALTECSAQMVIDALLLAATVADDFEGAEELQTADGPVKVDSSLLPAHRARDEWAAHLKNSHDEAITFADKKTGARADKVAALETVLRAGLEARARRTIEGVARLSQGGSEAALPMTKSSARRSIG